MKPDVIIQRLQGAARYLPAADLTRVLRSLAEMRTEQARTEREIAKIEATRDVLIAELQLKYGLIHAALSEIFDERRAAMEKHFAIIDRGIATNDRALIVAGLNGVASIVNTSPFADFDKLGKLLESGGTIEI